jgi:hypothetical protein
VIRAHPKKKTSRTNRRKYADTLWSKYIKARAQGQCQRCGSRTMALEAAHIVPRRVLPTRFDTRNGVALCAATCHRDFDSAASALLRIGLIQDWIGAAAYEELLALARTRWSGDYDSPIRELGQLLREAKKAA